MHLLRATLLLACLLPATAAMANTSHDGWPTIDGVLLINKNDSARPLDARPGMDPFGGQDKTYSCDTLHRRGACRRFFDVEGDGRVMTSRAVHNELLGGHGNDTITGGHTGDVLWGDYKPSGQPTTQLDHLNGGAGRDFIYASHGLNFIDTGPGSDVVHAHFGHGRIRCHSARTVVFISHRSRPHYQLTGCRRISYKTIGH